MALSFKHAFTSAKSDGADTTLVQPSNWNAEHVLTAATQTLVGRYAGTDGAVQEITPGSGLTLNSSTGVLTSATGWRNAIINGCFRVKQRPVSGTVTLAAGAYGHDRWKGGASGCTYTFASSGGVTTLTITAGSLIQVIEGTNLRTGTYVLSWAGTCTGKIGAGSFSASGVTASVTGGADLNIEFGTGTLASVQFESGTLPTSFEQRSLGVENMLCYRYCYRLMNEAAIGLFGSPCTFTGTTVGLVANNFPVPMRVIPTFVMEGAATDYQIYASSSASYGAVSSFASNAVTCKSFYLFNFTVGTAISSAGMSGYLSSKTANGFSVRYDAEL